jgi:hypothetical protein
MIYAQEGKFKASLALLSAAYNGLNPNLRPAFDQTHKGTNWSSNRFINFNVKPLQGDPQKQRGQYGSSRSEQVLRPGGLPISVYGDLYGLLLESLGYPANELLTMDSKAFPGYAAGGEIFGAGSSTSDSIPAWLSNGEHVLPADEVQMLGGQQGVYNFRTMLRGIRRFNTGGAGDGTNDTGYGLYNEITAVTTSIANQLGLRLTAGVSGHGTHDPDGKNHDYGFAGDFGDGSPGNSPAKLAFAQYMYQNYGSSISELIYDDPGMPMLIKDMAAVPASFYGEYLPQHKNHVHLAIKPGAFGSAMTNMGSPGNNQLTATTGSPALAPINIGDTNVGPTAYGGTAVGNPWTDMPKGMTQQEQTEYTKSYMNWQRGQAKARQDVLDRGKDLTKTEQDYAKAMAEAKTAEDAKTAAVAKATKQETDAPGSSLTSGAAKEANDAIAASDLANKKARDAQDARDQAATRERDANDALIMAGYDTPPKAKGGKGTKTDKDAESLGAGLVKGIFEGLGFTDDVFGKPFTEWGIWKLFTGGLGYGLNMLNSLGDSKGVNGAALGNRGQSALYGAANQLLPGVADAIPGAAPGSAIPGVANLIPGLAPPGVDPASSVTPAMATDAGNSQAQPTGPGASFTSLNFQTNNTGVMGQPEIEANVATSMVNLTRLVPAIGAAPLATV